MTMRLGRRGRLFAALGLAYLLAAGGAVYGDWPTPERLAEDRLRFALLLANALDKDLRPYDAPLGPDMAAQYDALVTTYKARFGDRYDVSLLESRYAADMAHLTRDRASVAAFAVLSTALIWWLLWTVWKLLGRE